MLRNRKPRKASLQKRQIEEFKKRNVHRLGGVKDTVVNQAWLDGYVCGAIHGFDKCQEIEKLKAKKKQQAELRKRQRERKKKQSLKRNTISTYDYESEESETPA